MVQKPGNTMSTHTLRLRADASPAKKGLDVIDKELKDVIRSMDRAQAASAAMNNAYRNNNATAHRLSQTTKQMRSNMQNLGYQLQDTVIQLEMGTHWTRVFAQQGSQVLGAFGPWPAILSAAGAAAIVIANNMGLFGQKAEEAKEKQDALNRSLEAYNDLMRENRAQTLGVTEVELDFIDAISLEQEKLAEANEQLRIRQRDVQRQNESAAAWQREAEAVQEATKAVNEAEDRYRRFLLVRELVAGQKAIDADILGALEDIEAAEEKLREDAEARQRAYDEQRAALDQQNVEVINLMMHMQVLEDLAHVRNGIEWDTAAAIRAQSARNMSHYFDEQALFDDVASDLENVDRVLARQKRKRGGGGGGRGQTEQEKILERQKEIQEAFDESIKAAALFGETMQQSFGDLAANSLDTLIDSLVEGKFAFKDFARSLLQDLAKIMIRALVVNQLLRLAGISPGVNPAELTGMQSIVAQIAGLTTPNAQGNVINNGNVVPFAKGGVVSAPTFFPMAKGMGLMGEAGPEAIMPLRRDGTGNLGVSGAAPVVNVYNAPAGTRVEQNGNEINVVIAAVEDRFARSMATGQGVFARSMESGYTGRRKYG